MRTALFVALAAAIAAVAAVRIASAAAPPTATSQGDAWPLYEEAMARIAEGDKKGISSPSASTLEYPGEPPFGAEWERMAKAAVEWNAPALDLVRQARPMKAAQWPAIRKGNDVDLKYLNGLRNVANEVGDAALYAHVHGDDAAAVEYARDVWHLADLLDADPNELVIQGLVAVGIRALALNRLDVISSEIALKADGDGDPKRLAVGQAKALIGQIFSTDDGSQRIKDMFAREAALNPAAGVAAPSLDRLKVTYQRCQMERNLTAMVLACRVYQFEHKAWPRSIDDFKAYLPGAPVDHWGPQGYVLLKGGRPDGADRPLVYSTAGGENGLAYHVDEPAFGFYQADDPKDLKAHRQARGQFRDVTNWPPQKVQPATRELK